MDLPNNINEVGKKCDFETALNITGFGKYNLTQLVICCLLILAMYIDIFGFSVALPSVACDMQLNTAQQGLLSAVPLIGVMISSYAWGLCADTLGRRTTLLVAMPVGMLLNLGASLAPNYAALAALKFFSAGFTSSANAAGFVLLGESVPGRFRGRFMFLMASATMYVQFIICVIALPITSTSFTIDVSWLGLTYRPWRLLLQVICIPGIVGAISMFFLKESPKFLLSKGKEEDAIHVLRVIYRWNRGLDRDTYPVKSIFLEETAMPDNGHVSFMRKMWNQTAPLFQPPLLKNSLKLYYILLCAYMTSTGYTMWVPTMTNAYFDGEDRTGKVFCEVASTAATSSNDTSITDCDSVIKPMTLYAVMCYSGISGTLNIMLTFIVGPLGKRTTTVLVFAIAIVCGVVLLFIRIPVMSIALFYFFLYVALILGNVNTYLVELNPTYLRGMATCLSVVVARGFGFFSVQLIASLLADHCTPMIAGYIVLIASGLLVSFFLPPDKPTSNRESIETTKL
ncbi:putative transporter SVOPL [Maniola hyperantus]|uniref:putative transporter SVOPL n=1 Tax=Aphantopus hyperantus TaxID=2795564 RepID=UPI00156823E5|nr:synaptic vesicle glycoprotein 2B-like [Maniola hyperantus]